MTDFDDGDDASEHDTLSALLSAELDKAEGIAPAAPLEDAPELGAEQETEAAAAERARDEQGRFAKKATDDAAKAAKAPEQAAPETKTGKPEQAPVIQPELAAEIKRFNETVNKH